MDPSFKKTLFEAHKNAPDFPSPQAAGQWIEQLLGILFPERATNKIRKATELDKLIEQSKGKLCQLLHPITNVDSVNQKSICDQFFQKLPQVHELLIKDADAMCAGDPAAISQMEVILTYPGFFAMAIFRCAHEFFKLDLPILARLFTEYAHQQTGIDIHPGAQLGERFCIDHGTGVVIGGTTVIGNNVKIYQGVTLGALSVSKEMAATKRHPTIEDGVVIYAGATILGGQTTIGHDSIIGGNVWLTNSVPPNSRIYYRGRSTQSMHTKPQA